MAASSANGSHVQVWAALVHVHDAVEGVPGILVDGGPHIGGDWLLLASSSVYDHEDTFAIGCRLHAHSLALNQPVVAKGVVCLQVTGWLAAVYLLIILFGGRGEW